MLGSKKVEVVVNTAETNRRIEKRQRLDDVRPTPQKYPKQMRRRRAASIAAYVGFNGSGKSLTMVMDTLPDMLEGRKILSTVALLAFDDAETREEADSAWEALGVPHMRPESRPLALPYAGWIPFTDFRQLLEFHDGVVLMDEVQGVADAREQGLPIQVRNLLYQMRRRNITLRWSTIDWKSADKRIRDVTQTVTYCVGLFPTFPDGAVWGRKRFFWIRTYDARGFDDFTQALNRVSEERRPKAFIRQGFRIHSAWAQRAGSAYDTMAQVLSLGAAVEAGLCMTCGGKRAMPRCSCEKPEAGRGRHDHSHREQTTELDASSDSDAVQAGGATETTGVRRPRRRELREQAA